MKIPMNGALRFANTPYCRDTTKTVGWVERSETQRNMLQCWVSDSVTQPT